MYTLHFTVCTHVQIAFGRSVEGAPLIVRAWERAHAVVRGNPRGVEQCVRLALYATPPTVYRWEGALNNPRTSGAQLGFRMSVQNIKILVLAMA